MKPINKNDFVPKEQIKTYEEIDGLEVIEELLLYKGTDIAASTKTVSQKHLDDMALVHYNLKVNATNRLYVGLILDKYYHRSGLVTSRGTIKVPDDIYNRVKELNDSFKTKDNEHI